eukprot:TRINITY_DN92915_c0_g1_i1.p2 TRINITY_DN92915_c0_g1~~TRINITY_DN92915_c0_g1_i1.p2  ORF type:complete len:125 (-),score=6.79 TRINITY_DN92915_c0_g1_i1:23-397(-)
MTCEQKTFHNLKKAQASGRDPRARRAEIGRIEMQSSDDEDAIEVLQEEAWSRATSRNTKRNTTRLYRLCLAWRSAQLRPSVGALQDGREGNTRMKQLGQFIHNCPFRSKGAYLGVTKPRQRTRA